MGKSIRALSAGLTMVIGISLFLPSAMARTATRPTPPSGGPTPPPPATNPVPRPSAAVAGANSGLAPQAATGSVNRPSTPFSVTSFRPSTDP